MQLDQQNLRSKIYSIKRKQKKIPSILCVALKFLQKLKKTIQKYKLSRKWNIMALLRQLLFIMYALQLACTPCAHLQHIVMRLGGPKTGLGWPLSCWTRVLACVVTCNLINNITTFNLTGRLFFHISTTFTLWVENIIWERSLCVFS